MSAARFRETWRDAARAIDRRPGEGWRDQLFHHGFRALVVVAIAVAVPLLFRNHTLPETVDVQEGAVATEDVIAAFEFAVPKRPDQLAREREDAERVVLQVYILDVAAADTALANVGLFFEQADSVFGSSPESTDRAAARDFLRSNGLTVTDAQLDYLADPLRRAALRSSIETAFRALLPAGVAALMDSGGQSGYVSVRGDMDRLVARDSITTLNRFHEDALVYAPQDVSVDGFQVYSTLLIRFRKPTLLPDDLATRTAREQARAAVDTVSDVILEGERIVTAHERVGSRDLHRLGAYNAELVSRGLAGSTSRRLADAGSILYTGILIALLAAVILMFRPAIYRDVRAYLIVMGLVALVMVSASLIQQAGYPSELIPVALLALLVGALYDGLIGFVAVAVVAAVVGGQIVLLGEAVFALAAVSVPFKMIAAGGAGALGIRRVRRRSHSWVLIALIGGAYFMAGVAIVLLRSLPVREILQALFWGGVSATLCTVLAVAALIPALEKLTGVSTDQTLLELSDLNAPLLRELSREAPGTYAHSINVANLAEAACLGIGANPLLVRAGVYYHDIGKMANPQFFVENQPRGRNPHDRLPPRRSAAIIRDHVKEGLRLASEHRLPRVIHDFIREHHGTTMISFFLDKAREAEPDLDLDPSDFAYPGPKPQSRETAVVMLADAIESATRVLQDPTPDKIRATIDHLVNARIAENQLDQCPLTLRDLEIAKAEFARVLIGMYHRRIEYPSGIQAVAKPPVVEDEEDGPGAGVKPA
jgi:putative nucleotidyltransferase with HDIG domain